MNPLKQFVIQFAGLKNGCHYFDFKVDHSFFEEFEYSIIKKGNLDVQLAFDKREQLLALDFTITGTVELVCDRCLDPFDYSLEVRQQQLVKLSDDVQEGDEVEDVVYVGSKAHELDVAPFIYEFIHLAPPIVSFHPDDEAGTPQCDPETLAVLEKLRANKSHGEDEEADQDPRENDPRENDPREQDPRWEALRNLRNN